MARFCTALIPWARSPPWQDGWRSRADLQASGFNRDAIRLAVESEVATNYVLARTYQAQLALARQTLSIRQDDLEIAGFRVKAGLVSSLDVEQARAGPRSTMSSLDSNGLVSRA